MPMNRTHMRRQLYKGGGIADLYPRQKYGIGSWVKERVRKLIPNELADVAVKAAPFAAMIPGWGPAAAGLMRGIGRFDQRGSMSDALKQGIGTYAGGKLFGKGMEHMKWRDPNASGIREFINQPTKTRMGGMFGRGEAQAADTSVKSGVGQMDQAGPNYMKEMITGGTELTPATSDFSLKGIWNKWKELPAGARTAIVGVGSGAIAGIAQWFENQIPQEPGESIDEYMARRKVAVGKLMRQYMDNTRAYDPAWTTMTDEQKDETVGQYYNQGGRVGYQAGGISMGNTLTQNIAANQAQRMSNQDVLQAARARLPGYTPSSINFQGKVLQQKPFGGPPSGSTPVQQKPYSGETYSSGTAPELPTLTQNHYDQLEGLRTKQRTAGIADENLIPDFGPVGEGMIDLGGERRPTPSGQKAQLDYLTSGVNQGLTYDQIMDNYTNERVARADADIEKYGSFADGRNIDPFSGKSSYNDMLDVFKHDYPHIQLTGNETLAELDQMMLDIQGYNKGGRIGYSTGTDFQKWLQGRQKFDAERSREELYREYLEDKRRQKVAEQKQMVAQGGRVGQMYGTGPQGLPGIPRRAPDGMEFDMRMNGGFQGLGKKEGKDDVPAMLAKNEFVFTADAVRGAGGGDIELGAQKMYDTMKNLEKRMA